MAMSTAMKYTAVYVCEELIAGHEAPEEIEGVSHGPLGQEPRAKTVRGFSPEVPDELGKLRDEPAADGREAQVEAHLRGRVIDAVLEPKPNLRGTVEEDARKSGSQHPYSKDLENTADAARG